MKYFLFNTFYFKFSFNEWKEHWAVLGDRSISSAYKHSLVFPYIKKNNKVTIRNTFYIVLALGNVNLHIQK